jgi:hypothetical protein
LVQDKKELEQKIIEVKNTSGTLVSDMERQQVLMNKISEMKQADKKSLSFANKDIRLERRIFKGAFLIPLLIMQVILSFLIFLTSKESLVLVAGLISFLVIIITALILNYSDREDFELEVAPSSLRKSESTIENNPSDKFVNSAILNALNLELQSINSSIEQNLGEMSYQELERETLVVTNELKELELKSGNSEILSTEEYYKSRRELDILKIEEENLQYNKNSNIDMNLVEKLSAVDNGTKKLGIPVVLINANQGLALVFQSLIFIR